MRLQFLTKTVLLSTVLAVGLAVSPFVQAETGKTPDGARLLTQATQRMKIMDCMQKSVDLFDDHSSPADVVASAVAWHCEAEGNANFYWIILAQRRSAPDTVDVFYRDLALLFVLQARANRLKK